MEEVKVFIIRNCQIDNPPIDTIKETLAAYSNVPDNAFVFWRGRLDSLDLDYRVAWYESGKQVDPIEGANSVLLKDFMKSYGSTSKAAP